MWHGHVGDDATPANLVVLLESYGFAKDVRVRLALKPRFLSKDVASQSVSICVFVAYRVSGHSTQDN